jgi:accessory gene regulator B
MAAKMAFFLVRKQIVPENKIEIHAYGLEILMATIINGILATAVSLFMGVFWQSVLMLLPFVLLRANAGGYHAGSHIGCMLRFMAVYIACLLAARFLPPMAAVFGLIIGAAVILVIGPLPHKNRPVSGRELAAYKVKSRLLAAGLLIAGLIGLCFLPDWFLYFALGMDIAAGSLLTGCIQLKWEGRRTL